MSEHNVPTTHDITVHGGPFGALTARCSCGWGAMAQLSRRPTQVGGRTIELDTESSDFGERGLARAIVRHRDDAA